MPEESRAELLRRLHASRRPVTSRQLERWCKADKVARPIRRHVPGVRGSMSVFPAEAFGQAAAMFDAARQGKRRDRGDRRLDERGFLLWWSGKPIAQDPRELVLGAMEPMFKSVEKIRAEERTAVHLESSEADDDLAFDVAEAYVERHGDEPIRNPLTRKVRQNLGRNANDFSSVVTALLTLALGGQPALDASAYEDEPSLASLILKGFAGPAFLSLGASGADGQDRAAKKRGEIVGANDVAREEQGLAAFLEPASFLFDRAQMTSFVFGLSYDELNASRKYSRVLLEVMPTVFEANELLVGQNKFAKTLRALASAPIATKAHNIVGIAWLVRRYGAEPFERICDQYERVYPNARAICTLAKAFPEYRELLLTRNAKRLAALSEETRKTMFESIKKMLTPD